MTVSLAMACVACADPRVRAGEGIPALAPAAHPPRPRGSQG
ncbi:hypothetical protein ACOBQX_25190 [Actinokineospora sp. G85]